MKAPMFEYVRPDGVDEVLAVLAEYGDEAKLIAGGQSLVPAMNMRLAAPALLVDLNRIDELAGIQQQGRFLRIGAMTRHATIARSALVAEHAPLLFRAAPFIAHEAIRNRGTFGGSLATADPASEWPACCLTLGARIHLRSQRGSRVVAAAEFFHGVYDTAIEPDELLTAVELPCITAGEQVSFAELGRRKGDYAIVGLAAQGRVEHGRLGALRLGFFGVADRPVLAQHAAAALEGQAPEPAVLRAAQTALANDFEIMGDLYTAAATKAHLARVLLGRAVSALIEEAGR